MDKHELELVVAAILAAGSFGAAAIISPKDMVEQFGKVRDELRQRKALSPTNAPFERFDITDRENR